MIGALTSLLDVPPRATGSIETYEHADGRTVSYYARVRWRGQRHRLTLGTNHQGWSPERARVELEHIQGQIERGTWEPPTRVPSVAADPDEETVQITASRWWQRRQRELKPNTRADYGWRLKYILADLAGEGTAALSVQRIDEFRERIAGKLSARSVNMVLDVLAQVLDDAVEYGLLDANPARGRRRRMRVGKPARSFLEPGMVVDLLDVAGEWEADLPEHQRYGRRSLLALLCLAGPRISEATVADRGDFDLAAGRWRIPAAKTDAGERDVELSIFLADELRGHVARRGVRSRDPMWPTYRGGRLNPSNIRTRLLHGIPDRPGRRGIRGAVQRANDLRERRGEQLLPARVTPHSLRRTFVSLALAAGRDPRWVMAQIGHADARLTLSVYAQVIARQRVDRDLIWRLMRFPDEGGIGPVNDPKDRGGTSGLDARMRGE